MNDEVQSLMVNYRKLFLLAVFVITSAKRKIANCSIRLVGLVVVSVAVTIERLGRRPARTQIDNFRWALWFQMHMRSSFVCLSRELLCGGWEEAKTKLLQSASCVVVSLESCLKKKYWNLSTIARNWWKRSHCFMIASCTTQFPAAAVAWVVFLDCITDRDPIVLSDIEFPSTISWPKLDNKAQNLDKTFSLPKSIKLYLKLAYASRAVSSSRLIRVLDFLMNF